MWNVSRFSIVSCFLEKQIILFSFIWWILYTSDFYFSFILYAFKKQVQKYFSLFTIYNYSLLDNITAFAIIQGLLSLISFLSIHVYFSLWIQLPTCFLDISCKMQFVHQFSSVESFSRVRLFATPWIAARQASLSITNSQSSLKLMSKLMPSSHLTLCCPFLFLPPIPPSIRVFSNESTLRMRWPVYWSVSFSINPSNEHPGLISIRMD